VEARDPDSQEVLHVSPFLIVKPGGEIDGFVPRDWDRLFTTTGVEFHLGQPPPHWFGSFVNNESRVWLGPALGGLSGHAALFLDQSSDRRPYGALPYELYQGGTLIESGEFPAVLGYWAQPDLSYIDLDDPGAYTLTITYDQYWVGDQPGQARVVAEFDTTQTDKNPPTLLALNVFDNGETTSLVSPSPGSEVRFRVQDPGGLSQVSLFYRTEGDWTSLPLTSVGDEYIAELPAFVGGSHVSLKILAQDAAGNALTYEVSPAFSVRLPPCDFDHDCDIDVADIMAVASRWRCRCGDECYDALYDLEVDCDIDIVDIMQVASRWGCECGDDCYGAGTSAISRVEPRPLMEPAALQTEPDSSIVTPSETFTVAVKIEGAVDLGGFQLALNFDPAVVHVDSVALGYFLGSTGRNTVPLGPQIDNDMGTVTFGAFSFGSEAGPSGDGVLAILTLTAQGAGSSPLELENVKIAETGGQAQTVTVEDGRVMVVGSRRIYLPLVGE